MAIPDFQSLMLPLLQLTADEQEHRLSETIEALAQHYGLTEAERSELLPSGRQATFDNRVGWAKTYLAKTKLLESTGRGLFRITQRGRDVLRGNPKRIDLRFLRQFPELEEFRQGNRSSERESITEIRVEESGLNPEETLERIYHTLKQEVAEELLLVVKRSSPRFFEKLVVDLLVGMGYGGSRRDAGQAVGRSGDNGIDGIIKEDRLGLDVVYIQAKRWEDPVGRPIVQTFAGSLEGRRARKGVLITTSRFTQEAREYVSQIEKKIVLIDGEELTQLMIDHGIGVTEVASYSVRRIDPDYFEE